MKKEKAIRVIAVIGALAVLGLLGIAAIVSNAPPARSPGLDAMIQLAGAKEGTPQYAAAQQRLAAFVPEPTQASLQATSDSIDRSVDDMYREKFDALLRQANDGHLTSARTIADLYASGRGGHFNPLLGCAWASAVVTSGSAAVTLFDTDRKSRYCEKALNFTELEAAIAQSFKIQERVVRWWGG